MYIILGIIGISILLGIIITFKYVSWFHWRKCSHCNHNMEYKGLREGERGYHYLFHCTHCGAWEQIPREEFIRSCDEDCNPNKV
jgi:hypothetical protein